MRARGELICGISRNARSPEFEHISLSLSLLCSQGWLSLLEGGLLRCCVAKGSVLGSAPRRSGPGFSDSLRPSSSAVGWRRKPCCLTPSHFPLSHVLSSELRLRTRTRPPAQVLAPSNAGPTTRSASFCFTAGMLLRVVPRSCGRLILALPLKETPPPERRENRS